MAKHFKVLHFHKFSKVLHFQKRKYLFNFDHIFKSQFPCYNFLIIPVKTHFVVRELVASHSLTTVEHRHHRARGEYC